MSAYQKLLQGRDKRQPWAYLALAALLACSAACIWQAQRSYRQDQAMQSRIDAITLRQAHALQSAKDKMDPKAIAQQAALADELNFPWAAVFKAVEKAGTQDVELLDFAPDKHSRRLVLGGETRSTEALVAYVRALGRQPGLALVHITHQQALAREQIETIEFEIRADIVQGAENEHP